MPSIAAGRSPSPRQTPSRGPDAPDNRPGRQRVARFVAPDRRAARPVVRTPRRLVRQVGEQQQAAFRMHPGGAQHGPVGPRRVRVEGDVARAAARPCGAARRAARAPGRDAAGLPSLSRSAQSSLAATNVRSSSGSGTASPSRAWASSNSARRPLRTASARSPSKSQKNGNGVRAPHSSPMNISGGIGASSVIASAARSGAASGDAPRCARRARGCRSGRGSAGSR